MDFAEWPYRNRCRRIRITVIAPYRPLSSYHYVHHSLQDPTPEDYPVSDVEVGPADFVARVPVADFRTAWEGLGADSEVLESFGLQFKSVSDAVTAIFDALGLAPCEGSGNVKAGTNKHAAMLAGVFIGGIKVLARMQVTLDAETGCVLKVAIRAEDKGVSELLMGTIS